MVVVTRSIVISIEDVFGAANGYEAVAGVADDLQPGLYVPAERTEGAVEIGGGPAANHAREGVAAVEFDQRSSANAGERFLPGLTGVRRPNGRRRRLGRSGFGLCRLRRSGGIRLH